MDKPFEVRIKNNWAEEDSRGAEKKHQVDFAI